MPGFKKHIAILLFGIFFFPLAYQPYHVFRHHAQKLHCHHGCCNSNVDKRVCSHGPEINTESERQEPCPICDYHFPINILPRLIIFQPKTPTTESLLFGLEERIAFQQIVSKKSPRAPPCSSLT